jgi:hypothetical protein
VKRLVLVLALVACQSEPRNAPLDHDYVEPGTPVQIQQTGHTRGLEDTVAAALRAHVVMKNWDGWTFVMLDVARMTGCRVAYAGPVRKKAAVARWVGSHRGYWVGLDCPRRNG